ncbi:tigger transposable element-derived protein 6-like protein [Plakobranchus ocellatus]|uniref:Tigger transposable element-derived protein 6-like protein n=1 Tax=Plakobranchus ocellatus TaxID=259542 RepID=A0AAV4CIP5_9GAST|nr:tigger transposable element-derived protein 6-like protein [Plakobranchus ocellatus]
MYCYTDEKKIRLHVKNIRGDLGRSGRGAGQMVRTYKKKSTRGQVSKSVRQDAVDAVLKGCSLRKAPESFQIPKETLRRAVEKSRKGKELKSFSDSCKIRQVFSEAEELELTEYVLKASRIGFPLDSKSIRKLSYQLAEKNNMSFPPSWAVNEMAGEDWLSGFLKRHECISRRTPEATSLARATAFNKTSVEAFFEKLQDLYSRYSFPPERVYNLDETGLTTSQKPQKVVAEVGAKQVAHVVSHERGETVTMCGFINAIGNALPPVLIFPRKKFKSNMLHNAPPGAKGLANQSGWMTGDLFLESL